MLYRVNVWRKIKKSFSCKNKEYKTFPNHTQNLTLISNLQTFFNLITYFLRNFIQRIKRFCSVTVTVPVPSLGVLKTPRDGTGAVTEQKHYLRCIFWYMSKKWLFRKLKKLSLNVHFLNPINFFLKVL